MVNTQKYIARATKDLADEFCLWLRGILPAKYINIEEQFLPPDETNVTWVPGNIELDDIKIKVVATMEMPQAETIICIQKLGG